MYILKKFKRTIIWKYILLFFIKPILDFLWKNIFNLHGRFLYFLWFVKKRSYIELKKNDKLFVKDNKLFTNLSKKILKATNDEIIEQSNKEIFSSNINELNESNSMGNKYSVNIFEKLDDALKKEIFEFATSEFMISTAAKYLGIYPILSTILVNYNIPRKIDNPRGAMLWHKDDLGYKSLDLFMAISNIDESNGPFFTLKERDNLGVLSKFDAEIKNPIRGERQKINLRDFKKFKNDNDIITLEGNSGTALFIDSFSSYHRGGHCKEKHRLLLRISYHGVDSLALKKNDNGELYFYKKIKRIDIKNHYKKFLLFKRSKVFESFNVKVKLLKLYNIINFKYSLFDKKI